MCPDFIKSTFSFLLFKLMHYIRWVFKKQIMTTGMKVPEFPTSNLPCYFFLRRFIYLFLIYFLERGREGEREGEKHQCVVASHEPPTGDLARNPGMCPDQELNR